MDTDSEGEAPRSAAASEILFELHEVKQTLMRLERLMIQIAQSLGIVA